MDPKHLFADERLSGFCVYCGGNVESADHVPSRVLLDEPFPPDLPVVDCCHRCNLSFSLDEQYLACFLECVLNGSPDAVSRPKIRRVLSENSLLLSRIAKSRSVLDDGVIMWTPEMERVQTVVMKLARGHMAFELSLPRLDEPYEIWCRPLIEMSIQEREDFLSSIDCVGWPEVGSRAFIQAAKGKASAFNHWKVVQSDRYQYVVSQAAGSFVRILLSNYLACEVRWE